MSHATIVVIIVILIIFFSGLFALYFYKCFLQNVLQSRQRQRSSSPTEFVVPPPKAVNPGLNPKVLKAFPTCVYSAVKQYRKPKYGLECAICLLVFEDNHVLRIITVCNHVFHKECVDIWFAMHKTCPVCRRNLEDVAGDTTRDSVSITIKDDNQGRKGKLFGAESLTRSKTTGHSLPISRDSYEDRFKLRLPDHVTEELIKSGSFGRTTTYIPGQGADGNGNV